MQHHIAVVPINIQFGQETYEEGISLSREEFYRKVDAAGNDYVHWVVDDNVSISEAVVIQSKCEARKATSSMLLRP